MVPPRHPRQPTGSKKRPTPWRRWALRLRPSCKDWAPRRWTHSETPSPKAMAAKALKDALASAETSFATMIDRAKTCQDHESQVKQLAALPAGADQSALDLTNGKIQSSLASATQANHDFEQAYATFVAARQRILAATAK